MPGAARQQRPDHLLTPDARADVWKRIVAYDGDGAAINAILASAFYLKDTKPVVEYGTVVFDGQTQKHEEWPGQLRCYTRGVHSGWLIAPRYMSSIDDACALVECALGAGWLVETLVRPDGSQARLHEFDAGRRTAWQGGNIGPRGAAAAIVKCVLQATDPEFRNL